MGQFETFQAYLSRVLTIDALVFLILLMTMAYFVRKAAARRLGVSVARYMPIALTIAAIIALSIRYWDANGAADTFWLFDGTLWPAAFKLGTNWVLNFVLYVPASVLLVLARKKHGMVILALVALSAAIETVQEFTGYGVGDPADFVSNSLGSGAGALLGLAVSFVLRKPQSKDS